MENSSEKVATKNIDVDNRAHLTISQWVSYISDGRDIHAIQHISDFRPSTHDEAYKRDCIATPVPQPLDMGWVKKPLYIAIINKEIEEGHVLYLSFSKSLKPKNSLIILPEACLPILPDNHKALFLRSDKPKTKFTIHVFPR